MEHVFTKDKRSLEAVFQFTNEWIEAERLAPKDAYVIRLTVEELFTNIMKYSAVGANRVELALLRHGDDVMIQLIDRDVERFDVTAGPPAETEKQLRDRPIGGLGLHLVREMVDELRYEYKDRCSIVTAVKHLERSHVDSDLQRGR